MPTPAKYAARSYRLGDEYSAIINECAAALAPEGLAPLSQVDVIRIALHRLRDSIASRSMDSTKTRKGAC